MTKRKTTDEFISEAKSVHGDKYDYSLVEYVSANVPVKIILDGVIFEQNPSVHLRGSAPGFMRGDLISKSKSHGVDVFIKKSMSCHGDTYDYSLVEYKNCDTPVAISCPVHGIFHQSPYLHSRGSGCDKCAAKIRGISRKSFHASSFEVKSIEVHGGKYSYEKCEYTGWDNVVLINCKKHGYFYQRPNNHLSGQGCPSCAGSGFDKLKDGYVYFLISDLGIKVGITNNPRQRIKKLIQNTPFDFHLIAKVKTTGTEAMRKEKYYHRKYESAGLTGFDGATEWLRYSPELMNEIINERG